MSKQISYLYDEAYLLASHKYFFDYAMGHTISRYIGWFFIALTQFAIVAALKYHSFSLLIFSSFSLLYWYYLKWQIKKFFLLQSFKQSEIKDSTVDVMFDSKALHVNDTKITHEHINRVIEIDEGFLVYLKSSSLFFAKSAFVDTKNIQKFRDNFILGT